jgi:hypothetical protein
MTTPIPQPPSIPLVGNIYQLFADREIPVRGLGTIGEQYGEIYRLSLMGAYLPLHSSSTKR